MSPIHIFLLLQRFFINFSPSARFFPHFTAKPDLFHGTLYACRTDRSVFCRVCGIQRSCAFAVRRLQYYRPKLTSSLRLPALTSDRITGALVFYTSYLSHFRIVGFPALRCSLFLIFFLYRPHKKSVPAQRPAPLFIVRHSFRDFRPKARRMIHFQRMTQFVNYNVFYQLVRQYY